jgi:hypothetical protein
MLDSTFSWSVLMQTYVVLTRSAWISESELDAASAVSTRVEDEEMGGQIRRIRSYVLEEEDGTLGTISIYEAVDEDAILEHAQRAEFPADEVVPVVDTIIIRDDP